MEEKAPRQIMDIPFMVIDFETVTPKGVPAEPIQLGLVQIDRLQISETKQKSWYIKPPDFAPITSFDTAQTGITNWHVANAPMAGQVFDVLEQICGKDDYIFVAQNANYELGICKRFYENRSNLEKRKFVDTIKLAKLAFPGEKTYKLDHIAKLLDTNIPDTRHDALTDCIITGDIFIKLVDRLKIRTCDELLLKAGVNNDRYEQLKIIDTD